MLFLFSRKCAQKKKKIAPTLLKAILSVFTFLLLHEKICTFCSHFISPYPH